MWTGCIAGAMVDAEYVGLLRVAGFEDVTLEVSQEWDVGGVTGPGDTEPAEGAEGADVSELDGVVTSAFVRARKPIR